MADENIKQVIQDAILDADSLERFINGSDSETVLTRLSAEYPTLQKAIKQMFENGGLPATPFKTKALMTASELVDGDYAMVTNDTTNNGLYIKEAGAWVKSDYSTQTVVQNILERYFQENNHPSEWEQGSFTSTGSSWNTPDYKARLKGVKHYIGHGFVKVECLDPDLECTIVSWDKEGNFHSEGYYTTVISREVEGYFNVIVQKKVEGSIDPSTLNESRVKITSQTAVGYKIENSAKQLDELVSDDTHTKWVQGGISTAGLPWNYTDRIRTDPFKTPLKGTLKVIPNTGNQKTHVSTFNPNGTLKQFGSWSYGERTFDIDGYYVVLVAWGDDADIHPEDADVSIYHEDELGRVNKLERDVSKLAESTGIISTKLNKFITSGEVDVGPWIIGSVTREGKPWAVNTRARLATFKNELQGSLTVESLHPDMQVDIVEFDALGIFIRYNGHSSKITRDIKGFYNIIVKWRDDRVISLDDVNIKVTFNSGDVSDTDSSSNIHWYKHTPRFSSVPFGYLLGKSVTELQSAFDNLVADYHGETSKENIGKSTDGLHDMFGYVLTPDKYEATVAITMHTHGNERYNPLGFYALLNEMNKSGPAHRFITWLRDHVRWLVVPIASPTAVHKNVRFTGAVNLNRSYDFLWDLWQHANEKGTEVMQLQEAKNIRDFVEPYADDIDFHMDLHDIPGGSGTIYSHRPAHPSRMGWLDELSQMREYLAEINDGRSGGAYPIDGGTTSNFFYGYYGIPSITAEHVTQHWLQRKLSPDQQIAKALEQTCGLLYLFKHKFENIDQRNSAYYTQEFEVSFASKEKGIHTWTQEQVHDAFASVSFLQKDTLDSVYTNKSALVDAPTIMVVSGTTDDDNHSDLTVLRVMQRIEKANAMYVGHLKNCNLVIVPALTQKYLNESEQVTFLEQLQNKHNPSYCLLVTAPKFDDAVGSTFVRTIDTSYLTPMTRKAVESIDLETGQEGLELAFKGRYTVINLKNEEVRHAAFAHTVAKWVGLVANDMASYFASSYY